MSKRKHVMSFVLVLLLLTVTTGCMKPSKEDIVESEYYQKLKEKNSRLSGQLKDEKKRNESLDKKIKAIHETSGDQKLADYKRKVEDSDIVKVNFSSKEMKGKTFAVTNQPVCEYAKNIVKSCYRMIGISPRDLDKDYKEVYSYALIDEDNTTFEFRVYGNSYIVFDAIPANVYAFNDASVIGEGLIDAKVQKKYRNFVDRIADAQIIVTDTKMKYNDTAIRAAAQLEGVVDHYIEKADFATNDWKEYRFYTYGTMTKVLFNEKNIVCVEDKNGEKQFYQISDKRQKSLMKLLK